MRRQARIGAFKLIYESLFKEVNELSFDASLEDVDPSYRDFSTSLFKLYSSNKEDAWEVLKGIVVGYELDRVYKVDLALILLAITEIKYFKETPTPVVVNEIIEIAKEYSTDKSSGFINGVLSKFIKEL